jgi:hypothetical protein
MNSLIEDLKRELANPEFARIYGAEMAKNAIGDTLIKIRKQLKLT